MSEFIIDSAIRGFHVYKSLWTLEIGKELSTVQETANTHDRFAVAIWKGTLTIGHVPAEISKVCWFFLWRGGTIKCRVSTDRHRRSRLEQGRAWRSLWTDLCHRQSEAIEEAQKDCIYTHTHTHTNNYIICLDPHNLETKTVVSAALARTHRITQYHKLHGGRLHRKLPKPRKQPK